MSAEISGMVEGGQLTREVGASVERAIEDELDWEHLPFTHASTFSGIELTRADRWGWDGQVELRDGPRMRMTVTLDADRLGYANSTFDDDGAENGRTVVRIESTGEDSCRMQLRFFTPEAPDATEADLQGVAQFYLDTWNRLIDEDEPKMIFRARALIEGAAAHQARRTVRLTDGTTCQVPVVCPHQGLPLDCEPDAEGVMTCPWHGYRFDARTGACLSGRIRGWRNVSG